MRSRICAAFVSLFLLSTGGTLGAADFVRGDVDANGSMEITDAVRTLGYLFLGEPSALDCDDAADANDSGQIDLSDAVNLLGFLFLGGNAPAAPFGTCGEDSTGDGLGCATFPICPGGPPVGPAILLNEVHPHPLGSGPELAEFRAQFPQFTAQFVEVKALIGGTSLSGFVLRAESGASYTFPAGLPPLAAGAIELIVFDGQAAGGDTIHAGIPALARRNPTPWSSSTPAAGSSTASPGVPIGPTRWSPAREATWTLSKPAPPWRGGHPPTRPTGPSGSSPRPRHAGRAEPQPRCDDPDPGERVVRGERRGHAELVPRAGRGELSRPGRARS